eukprot:3046601-Pleurochrysis_carterae.AAC.10
MLKLGCETCYDYAEIISFRASFGGISPAPRVIARIGDTTPCPYDETYALTIGESEVTEMLNLDQPETEFEALRALLSRNLS